MLAASMTTDTFYNYFMGARLIRASTGVGQGSDYSRILVVDLSRLELVRCQPNDTSINALCLGIAKGF